MDRPDTKAGAFGVGTAFNRRGACAKNVDPPLISFESISRHARSFRPSSSDIVNGFSVAKTQDLECSEAAKQPRRFRLTWCPRSWCQAPAFAQILSAELNNPLTSFVSTNDQLPDTACRDEVRDQIPSVLDIRRTFVSEQLIPLLLSRIDLAG